MWCKGRSAKMLHLTPMRLVLHKGYPFVISVSFFQPRSANIISFKHKVIKIRRNGTDIIAYGKGARDEQDPVERRALLRPRLAEEAKEVRDVALWLLTESNELIDYPTPQHSYGSTNIPASVCHFIPILVA